MLSGGHSKPCLSPSTCGFAEWWAPRSRPCFRWTRTPSPSITQCPEMFAPRPPHTHQSSSSSWSVAQRSCCGPAARAAGEPLGDSLSCHFLCVARRLLAGSQSEAAGLGAGVPAAPLQHHLSGKGMALRPACLLCGSGAPSTRCKPKPPQRRRLAQGLQDVCSLARARIKAPAAGEACGPHQAFLCSRSLKRTHLYEK